MTIAITGSPTKAVFHQPMLSQLGLPDWYGANRAAFRDVIRGLVEISDCLVLRHWEAFAQACHHDKDILREVIADYFRAAPNKQLLLAS